MSMYDYGASSSMWDHIQDYATTEDLSQLYDDLEDLKSSEEYAFAAEVIHCEMSRNDHTHMMYEQANDGDIFCNATFDTALCWPTTKAGVESIIECPKEYGGQTYEGLATKYCHANGTWNQWSNYTDCSPVTIDQSDLVIHNAVQRYIYITGYTISTVALIAALVIFLTFRALKCLRNLIHCHLIVTFIFKNIVWMLLHVILPMIHNSWKYQWVCKMAVTLFCYLNVTNFFWMLVEGMYLLFMVVWAFAKDKVKVWYLIIIGWCIPIIFIVVWGAVKYKYENDNCWLADSKRFSFIHIGPVLVVLLINSIILIWIIYILVTKLRATNCAHTRQTRKAIRATLILFPLLGLTYILYIVPFSTHKVEKMIFQYVNALLQSLQGFVVALFYCFLNGEVKTVLKSRVSQWHEERSVATTRYTRASVVSAMEHAPPIITYNGKTNGISWNSGGKDKKRNSEDNNTTPFISAFDKDKEVVAL